MSDLVLSKLSQLFIMNSNQRRETVQAFIGLIQDRYIHFYENVSYDIKASIRKHILI